MFPIFEGALVCHIVRGGILGLSVTAELVSGLGRKVAPERVSKRRRKFLLYEQRVSVKKCRRAAWLCGSRED